MKILMICLGNICRSPMAEGLMRHHIKEQGLHWEVDSCGTGGWHAGEAPDKRAQKKMREKGLDIQPLRARQIHSQDLEQFDVLYVMDKSNKEDVHRLCQNEQQKKKVKLILQEDPNASGDEVPDPYYGGEQGFEEVYQMLNAACAQIVKKGIE